MTLPASFPAARYRFDFIVTTPMPMREYAGSALRGAFGTALRQTVCVTRQPDCKACALYRSCTFPAIFAPPVPEAYAQKKYSDLPTPYVVEPPAWGERHYAPGDLYSFHMVLVGQALKHLPLIVHAWQRAFARGVGPGLGTAGLHTVSHVQPHSEHIVFQPESGDVDAHETTLPPVPPVPAAVTLDFATQVRLIQTGKPLGVDILGVHPLLNSLVKRIALISEIHTGHTPGVDFRALSQAACELREQRDLHWRDWKRYSNRQKQEMKLGGLIGRWRLEGDLAPYWPFLHWGQWLHVGKSASFGLGQYTLQV